MAVWHGVGLTLVQRLGNCVQLRYCCQSACQCSDPAQGLIPNYIFFWYDHVNFRQIFERSYPKIVAIESLGESVALLQANQKQNYLEPVLASLDNPISSC